MLLFSFSDQQGIDIVVMQCEAQNSAQVNDVARIPDGSWMMLHLD
jgi:hypothetical protein